MKKPVKATLVTLGIIAAIPVLFLATTSTVNAVATASEADAIAPYGELVDIGGKRINVVDRGDGAETIVLLPGLGTAAPALDFAPLIDALEDAHRVIAIEPLGTGRSDQADTPRTVDNIAREVHSALQRLGVDRYVLMGHSIAGIYAMHYSTLYPEELVAFVGIDSSVPGQPGWNEPIPTDGLVALRDLGILRLLAATSGDAYAGMPYDEQSKEQMRLLATKNSTAPTMLDEMDHSVVNFSAVDGLSFPPSLPVLLFVANGDAEIPGWLALHERQASVSEHGSVVPLDGEHYLHHTRSVEISTSTTAFLSGLSTR
ncbi:MAG: alpha/beta hydrolase [Microbacterium sp. 71-36]|uniref:alpha/beta hydrolase n=1 Tax=unclassified Microbacterium TaxID=2609290 RepID=UPI00086BF077|nr:MULTISPECIES: alpha/beta hydrolase [unclassified Microbacterium]MBN9211117.1 alpha/beta hydrolase [Microbacterium sp.]ODT38951.1 MAG: alpha/beta hydrolase [Microbacterium sp. SCN 71-17]OJV75256.1 MAG: alpha/beta hydrolase [Microbacterium sp. 71-36]